MARKVRVEFPGAQYHVMARGNERAKIFHGKTDSELFLKTLEAGLEQFQVILRAYCLMPNHFHLVVETPQANLSRFMAWLQTTFTVRYNRKHRRSGHLFQGRYRAEVIDSAAYGKWLLLYVHLNPVRTRKSNNVYYHSDIEELNQFPWSSHRVYLGLEAPSLRGLNISWLGEWGRTLGLGRRGYQKAVTTELSAKEALDWKSQVTMGLVAGDEEMLTKVQALLSGKAKETGGQEFQQIKAQGRKQKLEPWLKKEGDERVKIWARVRLLGERPVDLARERGYRDGGSILQIIKRLEKRMEKDKKLAQEISQLQILSRIDD